MGTRNIVQTVMTLGWILFVLGCAASTGQRGREIIPPGKGHLILEAGGIENLKFRVFDQATDQKVADIYSGWKAYLDPGTYRIVVETDLDDEIELEDIEIVEGQETHPTVPVGRFMVIVLADQEGGTGSRKVRYPFVVYDYEMKTVLGKGMTSLQVEQLVAPEGVYKIRLTPRTSVEGQESIHDVIKNIQVQFARVYPLTIDLTTSSTGQEGGGE